MNPRLTALAGIFQLNTRIYHLTLDGIEDAEARTRPAAAGNPALWIAGHATSHRAVVARLCGAPYRFPHAELFARGGSADDPAALPPLAEITRHWDEVSKQMLARFEQLGDAELDAAVEGSYPVELPGLMGALSFFAMHDSYHLGQLGFLRAALGRPGIAG
jgi:hypothetical protein